MPRSNDRLKLSIVPLLAASFLAGCGDDEETAYCVDGENRVVENRYCDDEYDGVGGTGLFFWYFGGVGGANVRVGERLTGGERISASDRAALARRGGFGSSSRGSGAGGVGRATGFSGGG